jgi:hypothetical protein
MEHMGAPYVRGRCARGGSLAVDGGEKVAVQSIFIIRYGGVNVKVYLTVDVDWLAAAG